MGRLSNGTELSCSQAFCSLRFNCSGKPSLDLSVCCGDTQMWDAGDGFCEKAQQKHLGWICCGTDEPWGVPGFLLWMILGALPTLRGAKPLLSALPSIPQDTRAVTEGLCPPASARNSSYSRDWLFRSHRDILKDQFLEYNQSHRDLWGVFQNLSEEGLGFTNLWLGGLEQC